jgi:hypothetical protein
MIFRFGLVKMAAATLIATAFLTACSSSQGMNNLRIGMTKQEVVQTLGNPSSVNASGNKEILKYGLFDGTSSTAWNQDYYVGLENGRVVGFGQPLR